MGKSNSSTSVSIAFPNALMRALEKNRDKSEIRSFIRVAVAEKLNREGEKISIESLAIRHGERRDLVDNPERLAALAERARNFMQPRSVAAAKLRKKLAKSAEKSAKKSAKTASKTEKKS